MELNGGPLLSLLSSGVRHLHAIIGGVGGPVLESFCKDELMSDPFDSKQFRESVDLPFTCHQSLSLN